VTESHPAIENLTKFIADQARPLEDAGIDFARGEVELMLCHILDVDRMRLFLDGKRLVTPDVVDKLRAVISRRITRFPLQYILGESWFYGRKFLVNEAVMVPTPETELLCETALRFVRMREFRRPGILDLGVGSGVIGLTLAGELDDCHVLGLDLSPEALEVAAENARRLGLADKIEFRQSDYFAAVRPGEKFDLILSNPPYITEGEYAGLPPEVLADPKLSLVSGEDGLDAAREIIACAPEYLADGGRIMFEIGHNQSKAITTITESDERFRSILIIKDLNDIDRIVVLSCSE
jgi:release factor glutamine methyltransferase